MEFTTFLLLISTILSMSAVNFFKKWYKHKAVFTFSAVSVLFTLLFFVGAFLVQNGFKINVIHGLLKYSLPFATCFCLSALFSFLAIKEGDLSLTGLFLSFSLILPTLYGIIFLNEQPTLFFWFGLAFFFACLVLTNVGSKKDNNIKKPITLKWVIFTLISCVTNGISPIIQTAQQQEYQTKYGSEMMMVALFFVFVVYLFFALFNEKKERKTALPSALIWGSLAGLCTGLLNFLVIIFTGQLLIPLSIFFPLISGGNLLVTFALGFFVLKEKYTLIQYVGLACGLISVVLLNV